MRIAYQKLAFYVEKYFHIDAHYFISGSFWMTAAQSITVFFGIITTALFAHYLSEPEYGIYRYLLSIGILLSSFSLVGVGQAILQAAAKKHFSFYRESIKETLFYSLGITITSIIASVYYVIHENYILTAGCVLIALFQPLINSFQFLPVYLLGARRFKESAIIQSIKAISVSLASIIALYLTSNIIILFAVYLLSNSVFNVTSFLVTKRVRSEPTPNKIREEFISYAKHTSVRNLISNVGFRLDSILVFTQLGAIELALYSIANAIPEQIKGTFKNLTALLLPKYAQHENITSIKRSIPRRSIQFLVVLIAITLIYCLFAPTVYQLLFPKYEDSVFYSQLFALIFPSYIYYLPLSAMMSQLDERGLYNFHLWTSVFQIIVTILFIHFFNLIGAVLARAITQYTRMGYCYWLIYKR